MSANNYISIRQGDDGIYRGYDISIEGEYEENELPVSIFEVDSIKKAVIAAQEYMSENIVEYGYQFVDLLSDVKEQLTKPITGHKCDAPQRYKWIRDRHTEIWHLNLEQELEDNIVCGKKTERDYQSNTLGKFAKICDSCFKIWRQKILVQNQK